MPTRRSAAALVAVMAAAPLFKTAVEEIRGMVIDETCLGHERPEAARSISAWFGQLAADRAHADTMLIRADVPGIVAHVADAISMAHPMSDPASRLPPDVKASAAWVAAEREAVPQARRGFMARLTAIAGSLDGWSGQLRAHEVAPHVHAMRGYAPHYAFIHALVIALVWPHEELVVDMMIGARPHGVIPDTGVWRPSTRMDCEDWSALCESDAEWNDRLYASIRHEGTKPDNQAVAWAAWRRNAEEVAAGWCTPVVGGWNELNARFDTPIRLMRRFGVVQGGKCRCCDSGTKSGHNPCTSFAEKLANVRADFPMEAAAEFAKHIALDGTWTMHTATSDVIAAFRRAACEDPSATVVAMWDPRPAAEGGQRVALFYVQGFNFGLKAAVMAYNNYAEFQTRAAVRLLRVVLCHYFDDFCCAEPDFSCGSAQSSFKELARLMGVGVDGLQGLDGVFIPPKEQTPGIDRTFLGVTTDFQHFSTSGNVRMFVPAARIDKVRATISEAIARAELTSGAASSLCGKLQFCLSWGVGRFGRAALGALYRQAHSSDSRVRVRLEMALNFFQVALRSLRPRTVCVASFARTPPVLIWSDATGTNEGEAIPTIAFVARFPGGVGAPGDPPGLPPPHPRWVHGAWTVTRELIAELEVRKQQVGQTELLAAVAAYYTMSRALRGRDVLHFIDNTGAVCGIAKGFSNKPDSARIIHTYHALNVQIQAQVHFEWIASENNIADLPSRGDFALLHEYGSRDIGLVLPPINDWLSPEEAEAHASHGCGDPAVRGGRRGKCPKAAS